MAEIFNITPLDHSLGRIFSDFRNSTRLTFKSSLKNALNPENAEKTSKQGNRGDMRKIHVTWQFFEASGRHGDLIEKTKNAFLDKGNGSMCAKFQVCIVFRSARRRDTNKSIHTQTQKYTHIRVNLRISSTCCSPHVDFENF